MSYLAGTELRASGETARRREPSTLDQLTPRERTIAELAASGLTNPEPRVSALPRARPGRSGMFCALGAKGSQRAAAPGRAA